MPEAARWRSPLPTPPAVQRSDHSGAVTTAGDKEAGEEETQGSGEPRALEGPEFRQEVQTLHHHYVLEHPRQARALHTFLPTDSVFAVC